MMPVTSSQSSERRSGGRGYSNNVQPRSDVGHEDATLGHDVSRTSSRVDGGLGIIAVEEKDGFHSRPPSRENLNLQLRGVQGILRPSSGIITVEGAGGFDSRPSSRGDVLESPLDKKKRLKSASKVTFPEAPGGFKSAFEHNISNKGDLSHSQLLPPLLPLLNGALATNLRPALGINGERRLGALFFGRHALKIEDYVRAKDAKMGVVQEYNSTKIETRAESHSSRSSKASSVAASVAGTPNASRPASPTLDPGGSLSSSVASSRVSSAKKGRLPNAAYLKNKQVQAEKLAREKALKEEQHQLLIMSKMKVRHDSARVLQGWCRSKLCRDCVTNEFEETEEDKEIRNFLRRPFSMLIALRVHCFFVRKKYEYDPYQSPMFLRYFAGCPRATILANWECNVAAMKIEQREFLDAHLCLKRALEDLHAHGMMRDVTILDLPTFHFSESEDPNSLANKKGGVRENPFCTFPGCSRRPVHICEWDGSSKICDMHQYPSYWSRDTHSTEFFDEHPMNIAYPNRREFMWMTVLKSLHTRLGSGIDDLIAEGKIPSREDTKCRIPDLILPRAGGHGADKYGGNPLHLIVNILKAAWTITIPDDCNTVHEALEMAKDDSEIRFRAGYYAWKKPVQVRKRIRVIGEPGAVLHGAWAMDERVGGGSFENITCVTACGQGFHLRGGKWHFLRCTLRGYGEGTCVLSCGGKTELLLEKSRVCGVYVDTGLWKPYTCVLAAGSSNLRVISSTLEHAAGYGMQVTHKAVVKIEKSEILQCYKAAVKLSHDADVLIVTSLLRDNTACFESTGQNIPVPLGNYDPDPEVAYKEDSDCLQIYTNEIHGIIWATRQKPKLVLGKCQYKTSAYKGDILKDNTVHFDDNTPPEKPFSGTGHESFKMSMPDNSALKITNGAFLMENYMYLRIKAGQNIADEGGNAYMSMHSLDDSNETREEYQGKERPGSKRPGTSGSSSSYATSSGGGILSRPGSKILKTRQNVMFISD